jgi:hypothetical protein
MRFSSLEWLYIGIDIDRPELGMKPGMWAILELLGPCHESRLAA